MFKTEKQIQVSKGIVRAEDKTLLGPEITEIMPPDLIGCLPSRGRNNSWYKL